MFLKDLLKALLLPQKVMMDTEVFVRVLQDDGTYLNYTVTGVEVSTQGSFIVLDTKLV